MKINGSTAAMLAGLSLACGPALAAREAAERPVAVEKPVLIQESGLVAARPAASSDETLVYLHRAATGMHLPPPEFARAAPRCCEPDHAVR